jgi:hypothetical protein
LIAANSINLIAVFLHTLNFFNGVKRHESF